MNLTLELILFALLVMVLNVMDSVTTNLCFRQYPDRELKGEANPIMRWLMLKSKVWAEVVKQGFVLGFVIYWLVGNQLGTLRFASVLFGLVVMNNTYMLLVRMITKSKVSSPIKKLRLCLHIPEKFTYVVALAVIFSVAALINWMVWG